MCCNADMVSNSTVIFVSKNIRVQESVIVLHPFHQHYSSLTKYKVQFTV